jgi:hypothetical protein
MPVKICSVPSYFLLSTKSINAFIRIGLANKHIISMKIVKQQKNSYPLKDLMMLLKRRSPLVLDLG